jgi:GNAT superfamily N-acetyltransferase
VETAIRLRDIVTAEDRAAVMGLRLGPGQDQYLNSMREIYLLWKLLIDAPAQGRGYGAATIDAVVDYLRTRRAPTCSTRAVRTARARPAGSICGTASPTRAA